jgi:diguanylate cyclase (GGDEF)-like protein
MPKIFLDLVSNIILLFALAFMYELTDVKPKATGWGKRFFLGLLIGAYCVFIMMNPFELSEGLIFDTRSVLISITGAFFSIYTTVIASLIAVAYRIYVGGEGVVAGTLSIILPALIGIFWRRLKVAKHFPKMGKFMEFYLFGLLVHVVVVLCQLAIPWPKAFEVISGIWIPFLLFFPIATAVLGLAIQHQNNRLDAENTIKQQKILLQSSIDSPKAMEIYAVDKNYKYLTFNRFHQTEMFKYYGVEVKEGMNFLTCIENEVFRCKLKKEIDEAFLGRDHTVISEVEVAPGKFYESMYTTFYDNDKSVIGVTVFSHDVTARKKSEDVIRYLSYHDALTGLPNRRYFEDEMIKLDQDPNLSGTMVLLDINGLKIMNDAFGHHAGDRMLVKVSQIVQQSLPEPLRLMRTGGDEFMAFLEGVSEKETHEIIDKCKELLDKEQINGMLVSVSFGIEERVNGDHTDNVIKRAEAKMYRNKLFEASSSRNESIRTILNTLHVKNRREEVHSTRVSNICQLIGKTLELRQEEINLLKLIGNLHDIGKIGIDEAILNKPGKLTEAEWNEIKRHPEIGYRILLTSSEYAEIAEDILSHHERWDGSGYPRGLKGKQIPFRARIIAIADAFDAMTAKRPYREPFDKEYAFNEIIKNAGTQFDPDIAVKFVEAYRKVDTKI